MARTLNTVFLVTTALLMMKTVLGVTLACEGAYTCGTCPVHLFRVTRCGFNAFLSVSLATRDYGT